MVLPGFFQSVFSACGFFGGILVELGKMNMATYITCLLNTVDIPCHNLFTGEMFNFNVDIFTFISNVTADSSDFILIVIRAISLLAGNLTAPVRTVCSAVLAPFSAIFPEAPAFIGFTLFFVFFIGMLKLIISIVGHIISVVTATIGGKS